MQWLSSNVSWLTAECQHLSYVINKQTDTDQWIYIHSHLLRPSDVIKNFVFKDKDLQPMVKDFVIKAKYKSSRMKK